MRLTEFEKDTIVKIHAGIIFDLTTFVLQQHKFKTVPNTWGTFMGGDNFKIEPGETIFLIENEDTLFKEMINFLALCRRLEGAGLIHSLSDSVKKPHPPMMLPNGEKVAFPKKVNQIFNNNPNFEIVAFGELGDFIQNGFISSDELIQRRDKAIAEASQRLTKIVSIASMAISTLTAIGIAWFNYKTYSKERKVTITNLESTKQPLEVVIIPQKQLSSAEPSTPNQSFNRTLPLPAKSSSKGQDFSSPSAAPPSAAPVNSNR